MGTSEIVLLIFIIIISYWISESDPEERNIEPIHYDEPENKDDYIYHPTTGYSAENKDQMDTYIKNRERDIMRE